MQSFAQSNEFFDQLDLITLSKIRSHQGQVFSLFLDLRPGKKAVIDLPDRFQALLDQPEQQRKRCHYPPAYRQQWDMEAERIRRWLETAQTQPGQGLALYSSIETGLWQVFILPVSMPDRLVTSDQPYLRPLEILLIEFNCMLVILIDKETAQFVKVSLGKSKEVDRVQAVPITGSTLKDEGTGQFTSYVIDRVEALSHEHHCGRLIIGGSDEALSGLRTALPDHLQEQVVGEISLTPLASMDDILPQVIEIESDLERNLEAQRVEQLIASAESADTTVGLAQTLLAVRAKNVRLLVVEQDFHQEGGECPNCGFLGEWEQGVCLLCEMALRPEPDIIEAALKRVLDHGGEIEILRSSESRNKLEAHGRIGALLRDSTDPLSEKEKPIQRTNPISGKNTPDALHDEAVDESFPASDPPSWSH